MEADREKERERLPEGKGENDIETAEKEEI